MQKEYNLLIFFLLLFGIAKGLTADGCSRIGYKSCITINAQCTFNYKDCSQICSANSSCSTDCCHNGYCILKGADKCVTQTNESSSANTNNTPIIAIIVPVLFGVVIVFAITCFCYQRRKRLLQQQALQRAMNNQNNQEINKQYNVGMEYQNQHITHMQMNQTSCGYNNIQFQPIVQPIQQNNPLQINQLYYPPQPQFFNAPQPQAQQQIPGIYEAKLGPYGIQPQPQMGVPVVVNPMNDGQNNYL